MHAAKRQRVEKKLHSAVELHHALVATTALELLLQASDTDCLARREGRECKRQGKERGTENQSKVNRHDHTRAGTQPVRLLQTNEDQRRQDHDGGSIQDTGDGCFADSDGSGLLALAETLDGLCILAELALGTVGVRQDGVDVDALADFFTTHEEDVQGRGTGDGGEGNKTGKDETGIGGDALETRDEGIQANCDGARGRDSHEVRLADLGQGKRGGFVGVGVVDSDIEGLIADLPEEGSGGLSCQCCFQMHVSGKRHSLAIPGSACLL